MTGIPAAFAVMTKQAVKTQKKGSPHGLPFLRAESAYLRWSAVASRAARNSESRLQFGHSWEFASFDPSV